jgi:hypothetical protein
MQENSRPGGYTDHAVPPEDIFPELPKHHARRKQHLLLLVGGLLLVWVGVHESVISPPSGATLSVRERVGRTRRDRGRTYPLGDLLPTP